MKAHIPEGDSTGTNSICPGCKKPEKAIEAVDRVIFFDLDNTLYPKALGIHNQMAHRIQLFFQTHLNLPEDESRRLGAKYYLDYGLAVRGIIRHFQIDPETYNDFVDGGLGLEDCLKPDAHLHRLIKGIVGARRWIFTNAGLKHAQRVLRLLGLDSLFEGIIYCDYREAGFPAKPDRLAYERAMRCAGISDHRQCYFIDDAANNVRVAQELGWHAVHLEELEQDAPERATSVPPTSSVANMSSFPRIRRLEEIDQVFPELFQHPMVDKMKTSSKLDNAATCVS